MNSKDRKKLRNIEFPTVCPTCEANAGERLWWMKRMREEQERLEVKLNQEHQANAQLRATLKDLTGK